jgi:hypothetical protein
MEGRCVEGGEEDCLDDAGDIGRPPDA